MAGGVVDGVAGGLRCVGVAYLCREPPRVTCSLTTRSQIDPVSGSALDR